MAVNPDRLSNAFERYLQDCYPGRVEKLPPPQRTELQQAWMHGARTVTTLMAAAVQTRDLDYLGQVGAGIEQEINAYALVRTTIMDITNGKFSAGKK